jgi:hypothetical protein
MTTATTGGGTAFGNNALQNMTTGSNDAFGSGALLATTTGTQNAAFGNDSLISNTSGTQNAAFGNNALRSNTTASYNTAVGYQSMYTTTTGATNTALGYQAGYSIGTGSNNICIGRADVSVQNNTHEIVIATAGVGGKGSSTGFISPNGGAVYQGNNSSTWSTTSDERIKRNFIPVTNGLEVVNALDPFEFDYIVNGKHEVGFKAQQYMTVLPAQVGKHTASPEEKEIVGEDEIYGIQRNLDPYFVSAIKSLTAQIEQLKAEIAALKGA